MERDYLPFHALAERHTGLTLPIGDSFTEAARVCLDRHHVSPIEISIDLSGELRECLARWEVTDSRTRSAWANEKVATEFGAYALALAAVELTQGMVAVRRADTPTGADYYIARPEAANSEDMEDWLCLEVSGIDNGDVAVVKQRLRQKVEQAIKGKSNLPALAAVIGFRARLAMVKSVDIE